LIYKIIFNINSFKIIWKELLNENRIYI
jgi:hypothetical protein